MISISAGEACIKLVTRTTLTVTGLTLSASGGSRHAVFVDTAGGKIFIGASMVFGAVTHSHLFAANGGHLAANGISYTISGGAIAHIFAERSGIVEKSGGTVTLTGTPAFSFAFAAAAGASSLTSINTTWSGSATGSRYNASQNSVIHTGAGGASYFPGNSAGATTTGGQYI